MPLAYRTRSRSSLPRGISTRLTLGYGAPLQIRSLKLSTVLSHVPRLQHPATVQGAFVAAGDVHDAFAIVGKVLAEANSDLLIVDPYANEVLLQDFVVTAPENALVRILTTPQYKAALQPAVERWRKQYGKGRPLEVRISGPKLLHDRLIIVDQTTAWSLTQSFKDLAARSPTSIIRAPPDIAQAKIEAYTDLWSNAQAL